MYAVRHDTYSLEPVRRRNDGRITVDAYLTRTGVFSYSENGLERREYRPPEEVFREDSLASFQGVPLTNEHPNGLLGVNARGYAVGSVLNVRRDGSYLRGKIVVFDQDTIEQMNGGKVQLSVGYRIDLDPTPGVTPQGERYDVIQRGIVADHVALVSRGRAGAEVRARMDSQDVPVDRLPLHLFYNMLARR